MDQFEERPTKVQIQIFTKDSKLKACCHLLAWKLAKASSIVDDASNCAKIIKALFIDSFSFKDGFFLFE